jgi:hypothetical protein
MEPSVLLTTGSSVLLSANQGAIPYGNMQELRVARLARPVLQGLTGYCAHSNMWCFALGGALGSLAV